MTKTACAPAMYTAAQPVGSTDTRLETVSRVPPESSRVTVRVLIANRQPIVRLGLRDVIARETDLQMIGEAADGGEAVRLARQIRPNVVLIDLSMPTVDGISATRMMRAELRDTQVVVMAGVDANVSAIEALRAGAAAYILKDAGIDELVRTIRGAAAGQVALPAQMAARMVRLVGGHDVLSHRETEILRLVARGLANKNVARELGITLSTVKAHVHSILSKLGLPSRTQLALYAARTGVVALDLLSSDGCPAPLAHDDPHACAASRLYATGVAQLG